MLTTFINNVARIFPHTEIDLLLHNPSFAELLQPLPGVSQTHILPRHYFRQPIKVFQLYRQLQSKHYDLAIDPIPGSETARFGIMLSGAKHRLGFVDKVKRREITLPVKPQNTFIHDALRPMELLSAINLPANFVQATELSLNLSSAEKANARDSLAKRLPEKPIIAIFTDATGDKKLSIDWWQKLVDSLKIHHPEVMVVELISAKQHQSTLTGVESISVKKLRKLAATLANVALFITADGGPLHLAAAAGTPTLSFFTTTNPEQYAPVGDKHQALFAKDYSEEVLLTAVAKALNV